VPNPDLAAAVDADADRIVADLMDLVRIPSISSQPEHASDVAASADRVAALCRESGLPDVQVLAVPGGRPAVIARRPAPPGAPTVLLYAHHDVQPIGRRADWTGDPFQPVVRDGRLFGRGAADDKAGVAAHLAAVRAVGDALAVGVTVFVEGEEEVGSPTFAAFLDAHSDLLAADVVVVADAGNWSTDVPAFTTSLRGLVECVVEVRTLALAQHSGVYGGVVPDALMVLCRLLASLHDDDGAVAVDGLVTAPPPDVELPEEQLRAECGVLDDVALVGRDRLTARQWAGPALTVVALDAPAVADAVNVLVPSARAKISLRTAPGQDGETALQALRRHLVAHVPWGARLSFSDEHVGAAIALDPQGPAADVAVAAFTEAWDGVPPVRIGVGGSIPFVAALARTYPRATVVVCGPGDPASRWHGPDESQHLGVLRRLALAEALLLHRLTPAEPR
jgi:acetylornithine deacetylase/succinyl-diaminopimelate desuccinylase-like protein